MMIGGDSTCVQFPWDLETIRRLTISFCHSLSLKAGDQLKDLLPAAWSQLSTMHSPKLACEVKNRSFSPTMVSLCCGLESPWCFFYRLGPYHTASSGNGFPITRITSSQSTDDTSLLYWALISFLLQLIPPLSYFLTIHQSKLLHLQRLHVISYISGVRENASMKHVWSPQDRWEK